MEFNYERNVYLERNLQGVATRLLHTHSSLFVNGDTAQIVATRYLSEFGDLFGLKKDRLKKMSYSHTFENEQSFITSVIFIQTEHGLPVWQAGILVQMRLKSFRILSAFSNWHFGFQATIPSKNSVTRAESIGEEELLRLIKCMNKKSSDTFDIGFKSLKIKDRNFIIFNHESVHYICLKIIFTLSRIFIPSQHWMAIVEVENLSVLHVREIIDCQEGKVFESESLIKNEMLYAMTR